MAAVEGEVAVEAERAVDIAGEVGDRAGIEKISSDIKNAPEELKQKLIIEKEGICKDITKSLLNNVSSLDIPKDSPLRTEAYKIVSDAFDKMQENPSVENGFKVWTEAQGKIVALDKSFGTKCLDTLKYPFEKMYNGFTSVCDYFTSDEGKVKKLALDQKRAIMNDPNATANEKIQAQKDYVKTMAEISPELDKSNEKGESTYGENFWKFMKLLALAGGVMGILALLARSLNGCYQYKIGKDKLKICDDFYHQDQNHMYCDCGPLKSSVCDDTTNNYPYCHCNDVKGQFCNMEAGSTQLYYAYDDSHTAWSLAGDVVMGAYNVVKKLPGDLGDLWEWFKKYGWIVLIVLVIIIGLPFIIGAINTTKEIYHQIHPDRTEATIIKTPTPLKFRSKK